VFLYNLPHNGQEFNQIRPSASRRNIDNATLCRFRQSRGAENAAAGIHSNMASLLPTGNPSKKTPASIPARGKYSPLRPPVQNINCALPAVCNWLRRN